MRRIHISRSGLWRTRKNRDIESRGEKREGMRPGYGETLGEETMPFLFPFSLFLLLFLLYSACFRGTENA